MRRIIVSLLFALLLLCAVVGLKNIATRSALGSTPVMLASGGSPPPPIPRDGGGN